MAEVLCVYRTVKLLKEGPNRIAQIRVIRWRSSPTTRSRASRRLQRRHPSVSPPNRSSRSASWPRSITSTAIQSFTHGPTSSTRPPDMIRISKSLTLTSNHNNKNQYNNCSGDKQSKSQPVISLTAIPHKEAHHQ